MAEGVFESTAPKSGYRIGVDVGGTNTDAALVTYTPNAETPSSSGAKGIKVVASVKSPTTTDVTTGIRNAISSILEKSQVPSSDILSVHIGTTHFINAVVQRDRTKLRRVAVLRLCGPFGREVTPFADWPHELRHLLQGPVGYLSGGLEVDQRPIGDVSREEVLKHARVIKEAGISAVVVAGVFSILDTASVTQEEAVKQILLEQLPSLDVVCSRDIGNAPFIERENAAILNASILDFGRKTIRSFEDAFKSLNLNCALYLTQNDGTVLDTTTAARLPIKTFSSGATNSLTGAVLLSGIHTDGNTVDPKTSQIIMVDIGGTTSDFAALAPSGFPRQSPATVKVGGVRTAFSLPELLSIGLGGGSHVHQHEDGRVTVGPTSVGHELPKLSKCFGGDILTATDLVVASSGSSETLGSKPVDIPADVIQKGRRNIRRQLERHIDDMKASDQDVVLLMVGGGSIIQLDELQNVKACIRPPFYDVANAVGAAIAKISGEVDCIEIPNGRNREDIIEQMKTKATNAACQNGAAAETIKIVEVDCIPLQDAANDAFRIVVRACGELSWAKATTRSNTNAETITKQQPDEKPVALQHIEDITPEIEDLNLVEYKPEVCKATGEWLLSEIDLAFIAEGCGVLGTGGGGSTYSTYLHTREVLRTMPKGSMKVIDPNRMKDTSRVGIVATVGAPTVSNERLPGESEHKFATEALLRYEQLESFVGLASGEIGGANGMCPIAVAAKMGVPVIDGDAIGRAFPRVDMGLPYVYGVEKPYPAVVADPRGNSQVVAQADSATRLERLIRTACIELGCAGAFAVSIGSDNFKKYCCHRTVSQCWYIGRAILLARQQKTSIMDSLAAVIPGCKPIFTGRVINVTRDVQNGWTIGTATIQRADEDNEDDDDNEPVEVNSRHLELQYQNEYFYAALKQADGSHKTLCTTPDLISVLDRSGVAIATHEIRYGILVTVIVMPAHRLWTTPEGLKRSDPAFFGLDMEYTPLETKWKEPRSVIEEFGV